MVVQKKHVVRGRSCAPVTKEQLADGLHRSAVGSRCEQDDLEATGEEAVQAGVVGVHRWYCGLVRNFFFFFVSAAPFFAFYFLCCLCLYPSYVCVQFS